MQASKHPEYDEERAYLQRTVEAIDALVRKRSTSAVYAADERTERIIGAMRRGRTAQLRELRSAPYFARIDFEEGGAPRAQRLYIGRADLTDSVLGDQLVVDYRAPVASMFYSRMTSRAHYYAVSGQVQGSVLLRRRYEVSHAQLQAVFDEYDARPGREPGRPHVIDDPEQFLRNVLSRRTGGRMRDIVTTIQAEQDAAIRAPHDRALLLQGVPGSGKTSVALHRVAYLLYPGAQRGLRPERMLVLCPTHIFLSYVSQVLPELDIHRVKQTTFADWALERMELKGWSVVDPVIDQLLDSSTLSSKKAVLSQRGQSKGSLRMASIIRRYVDQHRTDLHIPAAGLEYAQVGRGRYTLQLSADEIRGVHAGHENAPLLTHRATVVAGLLALLDRKYEESALQTASVSRPSSSGERSNLLDRIGARLGLGLSQSQLLAPEERRRVKDDLKARLERDLDRLWPPLQFPDDYFRLFRDLGLLRRTADGLLDQGEVNALLTEDLPPKGILEMDDVAPLYYFYMAVKGRPQVTYDHVVVDEAQDVPPLALRLIKAHVPSGSMTIIGDVAQSVYAHRGWTSWEAVEQVLQGSPASKVDLSYSYRSSWEIAQFTNSVRQRLRAGAGNQCIAFERHGPQPVLRQESPGEYVESIAVTVKALQSAGCKTVAVITKTARRSRELHAALAGRGLAGLHLALDARTDYTAGVLVVPVYLCKGLEFEASVVVDVDAHTYPDRPDEQRLLYVALTRALHRLYVFWQGPASPLLPRPGDH